jgi:glucosamine 6-phosphate synthetase-like amidotransferase/phosphosugar isomerase protein
MAAWPVVLRMYVDDRNYAKKIRSALKKLRGTYTLYILSKKMVCIVRTPID